MESAAASQRKSAAPVVVWDESLAAYDFGRDHPMAPLRLQLTMDLARSLGLLDGPTVIGAEPVSDHLLRLVHSEDFIAAVKRAGSQGFSDMAHGLGTEDVPVFRGMHEASAHIVGGTVAACAAVWHGPAKRAINISGGLHHAMSNSASGFCVYNDIAVGISWLLEQGVQRVAYVDIDVHHGDGVQKIFWDDPRVLTISLHESGRVLFPGTGFPHETGGSAATGHAVNVALPAGTGDAGFLRAFASIVPPLLAEFAPTVLVSQHGCDSHTLDPLAHLTLTIDGQRALALAIEDVAEKYANGRWVAVGGGGYEIVQVVPRTWTHLIGILTGNRVDPATDIPAQWRDQVLRQTGQVAPHAMTDGATPLTKAWADGGYDPSDWVDRAILATREAVFPTHGLEPLFDV